LSFEDATLKEREMSPMKKNALIALGLCTFALLHMVAQAADPYPNRPIKLIIPFPTGGSNDVVGRLIADQLSQRLAQPVVVDNRGGAGGVIGAEIAAKSEPDGYTLLFISSAFTANPSLYKLNFDQLKAFTPVAILAAGPNVLAVPPNSPYNSVKEVIDAAKAKPGYLNYASAGVGSFQHLSSALFVNMARVSIVHVPFKGGGPAMMDVMAGNTQLILGALVQTLPQIKAGKLKALGVGGSKRSPTLPDVPTIAEAGVSGYEAINWWGMVAPAATPKTALDRLFKELTSIQNSPEVIKRFQAEAVDTVQMSQSEFGQYLITETNKWSKVVKEAGITPQ
jgi:tripartite-type tricarboxylate transporter receptor subunit TctC